MLNGEPCCLAVIDVINDIVGRGGAMARCAEPAERRGMISQINQALAYARSNGWLVALVRVAFQDDYLDAPVASPIFSRAKALRALRLNTPGTDWHPALHVQSDDTVFVKKGISAFCQSGFDEWLKSQAIQNLVICGASSVMAVEATVRDAHDLGYACRVLEDACAAPNDSLHQRAMEVCTMLGSVITVSEMTKIAGSNSASS